MAENAPEVLFYHLEEQRLEAVLPTLLEKTLARGWRAVVKSGSRERLDALNGALWTYRDDSFLAHGAAGDGAPEHQPIYLTCDDDAPNGAGVKFLVDGGETGSLDGFVRVVHLFDGYDPEAVARARSEWKSLKALGCACTYWQQSPEGRWQKKA